MLTGLLLIQQLNYYWLVVNLSFFAFVWQQVLHYIMWHSVCSLWYSSVRCASVVSRHFAGGW